jgi:hypothetical protein
VTTSKSREDIIREQLKLDIKGEQHKLHLYPVAEPVKKI